MKTTFLTFCLLYQVAYCQTLTQQTSVKSALSEVFTENKGQVMDQYNHPNNSVLYLYSSRLFNLQLKQDGFSYELFEPVENQSALASVQDAGYVADAKDLPGEFTSHRVDVKFEGCNLNSTIVPEIESESYINFYTANTGADGVMNVHTYEGVTYHNIYPGIDLHFSAPGENNASLKYEWVVNAGADASAIEMVYDGSDGLTAMADGSVNILTSAGIINEGRIISYFPDKNEDANVSYAIENNRVKYNVPPVKDTKLVIDPNIAWFSFYGGNGEEDLFEGEMSVDIKGYPLLTGNTTSTQYIASFGAYQTVYKGMVDAFVTKFKPNGRMAWATYYGSADRDGGHAIVADDSTNVFMSGNTFGASDIATAGSHQPVFGGLMDAFIVKFSTNGFRQWSTYYGGSGYGDQINGIDCDASGNLYFAGYTASTNQIATPGAYQQTLNGIDYYTGDVMIGKFAGNGTLIWCSYYSGPDQDRAQKISLGKNSDLWIAGTCESTTGFGTSGVHQSTYGGGPQDAFISKWDVNGNFFWCSYYGGEQEEHDRGLAVDQDGNAYISGWTNSETAIATPGAYQEHWYEAYNDEGIGTADGYFAKFKPDGSMEWGTYYGGEGLDRARSIVIDKQPGTVYLAGQSESDNNVATSSIFDPNVVSVKQDGFLAKFSSTGEWQWGYYAGGAGVQIIYDADVDNKNFLYLFMATDTDFNTTTGVYQTESHGGPECMLVKFNPSDSCYDGFEVNNSFLSATEITAFSDTTFFGYTGTISGASDDDWFKLKTLPTNLKIELKDLAADFDLFLYLNNGDLLYSSAHPGNVDEEIIFNNVPKNKFYIQVAPGDLFASTNSCYRMRPLRKSTIWLNKEGNEETSSISQSLQAYLFPNPVAGEINVKVTSFGGGLLHANLYDELQRSVTTLDFPVAEGTQWISIPAEQLASGIYFLHLQTSNQTITLKVVKP